MKRAVCVTAIVVFAVASMATGVASASQSAPLPDNTAAYDAWIGNPHRISLSVFEQQRISAEVERANARTLNEWETYFNHDGYINMGIGNPHL